MLRITLIAPFPIFLLLFISRGGPPDPLYSQIKRKNNSDCNICNLVLGKFPWVDPRTPLPLGRAVPRAYHEQMLRF